MMRVVLSIFENVHTISPTAANEVVTVMESPLSLELRMHKSSPTFSTIEFDSNMNRLAVPESHAALRLSATCARD
jgi:hypothetical protein